MKPEYGLFHEENDYFFFNRDQDKEKEYMLVGMLIGLAIYNAVILDVAFPTVIFKKLAGQPGVFSDLEEFEPDIYRNLSKLLDYDVETINALELTFTMDSQELEENGNDKKVTRANCHEYVELYSDFLLNKSIEKTFNAFERGFQLVTHNSPLTSLFRPEELESMVIGQREYDWSALKEWMMII